MIQLKGGRIQFRPMLGDNYDAELVTRWRNTPSARQSFYCTEVVTPDTHKQFMAQRRPHDLVWMVETNLDQEPYGDAVGMTALKVDTKHGIAEYGRTYIDDIYRGQGYAKETEYLLLHYAFEVLNLAGLWLDAYESNQAVINLHYKTGWLRDGIDRPGHTDPRGPVLHMIYMREDWQVKREDYRNLFKVELPAWHAL